jgi:hypothetical protein
LQWVASLLVVRRAGISGAGRSRHYVRLLVDSDDLSAVRDLRKLGNADGAVNALRWALIQDPSRQDLREELASVLASLPPERAASCLARPITQSGAAVGSRRVKLRAVFGIVVGAISIALLVGLFGGGAALAIAGVSISVVVVQAWRQRLPLRDPGRLYGEVRHAARPVAYVVSLLALLFLAALLVAAGVFGVVNR